jgi:small subunit ribosomal protein S17
MPETTETQVEKKTGNKNEKVGNVVSAKMAKTIVVEVTRRVAHPVYKRIISKRKKFYAHDETNDARVGDVVRIVECRPLSKLKHWQLKEILRRAPQVATDLRSIGIEAAPAKRPEKKKK